MKQIRQPSRILFLILLIHVSWRGVIVFQYPLFDMADELFHFDYAVKLDAGQGLIDISTDQITNQVFELAQTTGHWKKEGIVTPTAIGAVTPEILDSIRAWGWYAFDITGGSSYEGVQPPLYYFICSLFMHLTPSMLLKAYIARLVSVGFSVLTLLATYWLIRKGLKSEFIALGSVLILTVFPSWSFQAFRISNDIATQFFILFTLLIFFKFAETHQESKIQSILILGIITGLTALTKISAVIVVLPLLLICYMFFSPARASRRAWSFSLICLIAGALSAWFYFRNLTLYGDIIGGQAIVEALYFDAPRTSHSLGEALMLLVINVPMFPFNPFPHAHNSTIFWFTLGIWLLTIMIVLLRVGCDIVPNSLINRFVQLFRLNRYPHRNKMISSLFIGSVITIGIATLNFMITVTESITERYVMVGSGIATGYLMYSITTLLQPKQRLLFLSVFILIFTIASIYQQYNLILMMTTRLQT